MGKSNFISIFCVSIIFTLTLSPPLISGLDCYNRVDCKALGCEEKYDNDDSMCRCTCGGIEIGFPATTVLKGPMTLQFPQPSHHQMPSSIYQPQPYEQPSVNFESFPDQLPVGNQLVDPVLEFLSQESINKHEESKNPVHTNPNEIWIDKPIELTKA